jgi:hypothetical protein
MAFRRHAALLFAGLLVMACGPRVAPSAQTSPALSPTATTASAPRTSSPTPTPTQEVGPTPTPVLASITCFGGPGAAMAVIASRFVYDVSDPVHPRLVCRGANTVIHLLDGNAIAYITAIAGQVVIVRRDLTNAVETRIAQLPADPRGAFASWTSDGLLEVYASGLQMHLWSNGTDHVLYAFGPFAGGFESRWNAPWGVAEFSPDHAYLAISYPVDFSPQNFRIFSVADRSQVLAVGTGYAHSGTSVANDRFVWGTGSVMQWTPTGGATVLRSERWFGPTSSSDGRWLAATLLTDTLMPRVVIVPVGGGQTFVTGLGSGPGFVTPTIVWYAEEAPCPPNDQCGADATGPDRTVHAFDVTNGSDQVVRFRIGEEPIDNGYNYCCAPGS